MSNNKLGHSIFQGCQRSVSIHLLPDPVDLLFHFELLEHGAEGVGDNQDHDEETNEQDDECRKNGLYILHSTSHIKLRMS